MSLNFREIDAVLAEWDLDGSWLRRVRQSDFGGLLLEFSAGTVALVVREGFQRVHLTQHKPKALSKPPRFAAVLKSRLEGAKLVHVGQIGSDRVVRFAFKHGDDDLYLDMKLWGGGANIILANESQVLDSFTRRPRRGESPGRPWPPEGLGSGNPPSMEAFPVREFPGDGSFNQRLEAFYRDKEIAEDRRRRGALWAASYTRRERHLAGRETDVDKRRQRFLAQVKDGHWGDLILANLHHIGPKAKFVEVEDWDVDGEVVRIPLDPSLSGQENAQRYFAGQKRARRALSHLDEDLLALKRAQNELEHHRRDLEAGRIPAGEPTEITAKGKNKQDGPPGLMIPRPPHLILVGRTAAESDTILRRWAKGNDLWLHTRDVPGGHVFIRSPRGKTVPLEVLLDAGTLAVAYSKAKNSGSADLYYTAVKHLRRPKDGKAGTVLPTQEKNLHVSLDARRLAALKAAAETA